MAIHLVQIREIVQLKGIKQRKYGSTDLKMMPIALSVRKGQPMAAVLGRADGIGIIFVLSSFRMVVAGNAKRKKTTRKTQKIVKK